MENNIPGSLAGAEEEFMDSLANGVCPQCGSPVYQKPRGRTKMFCSDACRFAWKNRHPHPERWKSTRVAICEFCGREFLASREYQGRRRFCSRTCANRARAEANAGRGQTGQPGQIEKLNKQNKQDIGKAADSNTETMKGEGNERGETM